MVPELEAAPRVLGLGRAGKPGSEGGGDGMPPKVGDTLQLLGSSRRGKSWGGRLEAEVFFSLKKIIKAVARRTLASF